MKKCASAAIAVHLLPVVVVVLAPDLVFGQCQWDPRSPSVSPSTRSAPAMAYDASRAVTVLFGGWSPINNETWEWNGVNWSQRSPADRPSARIGCAMAYDAARGVTVVFGGSTNNDAASLQGDTWEWDGVNWLLKATGGPARQEAAMAYDASRGVTVLFGGWTRTSNGEQNETWEWDGTTWTQRTPPTRPPARANHAMANDPVRGATILFGGAGFGGTEFSDTWTWNGLDWASESSSTGPTARAGHGMVYDTTHAVTLLFGGLDTANVFSGETWEWDGSSWALLATAGPLPRYSFGMAYDVARQEGVLFGGGYQDNTPPLGDTWVFSCCTPPSVTLQPRSLTVCAGTTALLSVTAAGSPPPTYQWRRDGVGIPGANDSVYEIPDAASADTGNYDVEVGNACGPAIISDTAVVQVWPLGTGDVDGSGIVDGLDIAGFLEVCLASSNGPAGLAFCAADIDGNGAVNFADVARFVERLVGP